MMEVREMPQKVEMFVAPGDNIVKVIAPCDRSARYDFTQGIDDTPGLAVIIEFGKVVQKQGQPRPRHSPSKIESKIIAVIASLPNQGEQGITAVGSTPNYAQTPVNLTSQPWQRGPVRLTHTKLAL